MPRLVQRQLVDVANAFAPMESLDLSLFEGGSSDLLISSLGFEPRCLSVPSALASCDYAIGLSVVIEYETNTADNELNWPSLSASLGSVSERIARLAEGTTDYIEGLQGLLASSSAGLGRTPKVILDVSVMANRVIMPVMKVLLEQDIDLTILYAEAQTYFPTEEEYLANRPAWCTEDELGLERGVGDVQFSREYPGLHLDPLPDSILLFPNFRAERSKAIISLVDPALPANPTDRVVWLLSVPHLASDRWRTDAMKEMNAVPSDAPVYNVGTFDYREALPESVNAFETARMRNL